MVPPEPGEAGAAVTPLEQALDRLGRRGRWEITPRRPDEEGAFVLQWVTRGQWGNPFAPSWLGTGDDLELLAVTALERSEPHRSYGLEDAVFYCLEERERHRIREAARRERERVRELHRTELRNLERLEWAWMRAEGRAQVRAQHRIDEARRILA